METIVCEKAHELELAAAAAGAALTRSAILRNGKANLVPASGASQIEMLTRLAACHDVDLARVAAFHLDEFVGISPAHTGSSRMFLKRTMVQRLPQYLRHFHRIDPSADVEHELARLAGIISEHPIDVTFMGIGGSGRIAANEPPADSTSNSAYRLVILHESCRQPQMREGGFQWNRTPWRQCCCFAMRLASTSAER